MKAALLVIVSLVWLTGAAHADDVGPGDSVAGHPDLTYLDLMRLVVTDIDATIPPAAAKAHAIVPFRHIEGPESKTAPAGAVAISSLSPLSVHADGKTRLALLADLGPSDGDVAEFALLALFDPADKPKLLDVVEVGRDRLTGFTGKPVLPIGKGTDLILVSSDHFNSSQDYVGMELIFVRNDRFALAASIFTFDDKSCALARVQDPVVTTRRDPASRYDRIVVTVRETVTVADNAADCSGETIPRPSVRTFQADYRWDARRQAFATSSRELDQLAKENAKRF